jgi:GNAT superfamily N-acetyltransferase
VAATLGRVDHDLRLISGPPDLVEYLRLRVESGLSPKTREQGEIALRGGWAAFHVLHQPTSQTVGMGRVIGDGGWYFHIIDMAVLPTFQRRGIGAAVLTALVDAIRDRAPAGAFITLLADGPGRPLYLRHGFVETGPATVGMVLPTG